MFHIEYAVGTGFELLESRGVDGNRRLGGAADGPSSLGSATALAVAVERDASIFGMDSTVMAEEQIAPHKRAAAFHALERPLLGVCIWWLAGDKARMAEGDQKGGDIDVRDRSCLLLCSLLLKARLQNWHLYFLSGASEAFRGVGVDAAEDGTTATLAPGILEVIAGRV
jgi:hypothetical protein